MSKDARVCHFCHDLTMAPAPYIGKDWYQCTACGATECVHPTVARGPDLVTEPNPSTGNTKYRLTKKRGRKQSLSRALSLRKEVEEKNKRKEVE